MPPRRRPRRSPASLDEGNGADAGLPTKMSNKRKRRIAALVIALVILGLLFAWYLLNRKPLSELPGLSDTKMPHYELSIYGATQPLGVAANPSGDRIYVTESDGQRLVRVYDRAGKQIGTLKPPASTGPAHTTRLRGHQPDHAGRLRQRPATFSIYIYDAKGKFLRTFAPKGDLGGKWTPLGLAFGPDGTLYATDVRGPDLPRVTGSWSSPPTALWCAPWAHPGSCPSRTGSWSTRTATSRSVTATTAGWSSST